jgi:hypothetical protein
VSDDPVVVDRPRMPAAYGPMEGLDGVLPWDWAEGRLTASRNYWVATTGPTGAPHVAPVWGVWVGSALWFGTDPTSAKGRNLARDGRVVVHLESGDEAVIVHGRGRAHALEDLDPELLAAVDGAYAAKYADPETGEPLHLTAGPQGALVHVVRPRLVLGWHEDDFLRSRTRWRFPAADAATADG